MFLSQNNGTINVIQICASMKRVRECYPWKRTLVGIFCRDNSDPETFMFACMFCTSIWMDFSSRERILLRILFPHETKFILMFYLDAPWTTQLPRREEKYHRWRPIYLFIHSIRFCAEFWLWFSMSLSLQSCHKVFVNNMVTMVVTHEILNAR